MLDSSSYFTMTTIDHKTERANDVSNIKNSVHPRKVVVAGPGTGKSFLFSELIKKKFTEGKNNFLAITFIGKLSDALADDLCGLAKTQTMHSFARSFVLKYCKGWMYYPKMHELIAEDLKAEGIEPFKIGDKNYVSKTKYYKAVGDADVVHYAARICKKDKKKIPIFDLIVVDEYQDFNAMESEFVDLLAQKNEIVIVGDDDQALYGFKGSSPSFIRAKFDPTNTDWKSFTLRFCSRCPQVIIKYFHALVAHFNLSNHKESDVTKRRIDKEYICYLTGRSDGKDEDSIANSKIHLIKNCPVGMIAYKVKEKLEEIIENQKIKDVLVIGEGRTCEALLKTIAQQLKNYGFKNVDYRGEARILPVRQSIIDAYKFIAKDDTSLVGWRILGNPTDNTEKNGHLKNARTLSAIIGGTPSKLEKIKHADILLLEEMIEDWGAQNGDAGADGSDEAKTAERHKQNEDIRKNILIQELKRSSLYLPRPLCNLDITVCNILNAKGLGADVVFVIGFDQGKFPSKENVTESEIYQMLVAVTRAKKRIYLINTISSKVSRFADCLDTKDLSDEGI
jgi:superfamily I DNA/RNA helicase